MCKVTHIHILIRLQSRPLSPVKRDGFDPETQIGEIYGPLAPQPDSHFHHHSATQALITRQSIKHASPSAQSLLSIKTAKGRHKKGKTATVTYVHVQMIFINLSNPPVKQTHTLHPNIVETYRTLINLKFKGRSQNFRICLDMSG